MKPTPQARLNLEPLTCAHAVEMFAVLTDPEIYRFLDYGPPSSESALKDLYTRLEVGKSPDGSEIWLNWILRLKDGRPIGYVQATVSPGTKAYVGYVLASEYWGHGYGFEAMTSMLAHLAGKYQIPVVMAVIEVQNLRSAALLCRLNFRPATPAEASTGAFQRLNACTSAMAPPNMRPNPSLKGSTNGGPRGPGWRYAVHFRQPGPRVPPLAPP